MSALPIDEPPALRADDLAFAYPQAAPTFNGVMLTIRPREVVALVGTSGCGKSTLLRVLAGLQRPGRGSVRFFGEPLSSPHPRSALLFQQPSLLPWLRVRANVAFGLDFEHQPVVPPDVREQRVKAALAAVGLAADAERWPAQLSGGMAQRVALARALAREPLLLFADEPFSALDAITRAQMQRLLVDVVHRWATAVLLVTHDIDEALQVADRVVLLAGGRLQHEWLVDHALEQRAAQRAQIHAALHRAPAFHTETTGATPS